MNRAIYGLLILLVAAAVVAVLYDRGYFASPEPEPVIVAEKVPLPEPRPKPEPEQEIAYPVPEPPPVVQVESPPVEPEEVLPALGRSDALMRDIISRIFAGVDLDSVFITEDFIRRIVIMIDSLPREKLSQSHLPLRPLAGPFVAAEWEGGVTISPENYRRYEPYVRLLANVDGKEAVAAYVRVYPLFQKAYAEMGREKGYFNDRLIAVIDHLLDAPDVSPPVSLEPHIMRYKYADPQLETLSAGKKIMIRIGPENAASVKVKLRLLRKELLRETSGKRRG